MAWTEEAAKAPIFSVTVFILLTSKLGVYTEFKIMKGLDHSKDYIEIECTPPLNLVGMEVVLGNVHSGNRPPPLYLLFLKPLVGH